MKKQHTRTGATLKWNELGPKDVAGRVSEMAFTKNKKPFAGGDMGGVWSNNDISSNLNWQMKTPNIYSYYNISSVATHPSDANIIYFATGKTYGNITKKPGDGIFKSVDGGLTWNVVSITKPANCFNRTAFINKIKVAMNGDVFVATARVMNASIDADTNGIFVLSSDNTTFKRIIGTSLNSIGFDIERAANGEMWFSCLDIPNSNTQRALYRSTFNGTKWNAIPQTSSAGAGFSPLPINEDIQRVELACAPNNANVIYALYHMDPSDIRVYKTTDGPTSPLGTSMWTKCTDPLPQVPNIVSALSAMINRDLAIVVDPNDKDIIYIGSLKVARGNISGSTAQWTDISSVALHEDIASLVFFPNSSKELYACTDGGVYKCKNPATTTPFWTYNSVNLNITQFNSCAMNNTMAYNFLAGAQDNKTQWLKNASGISTSVVVGSGDGLSCFMGTKLTTLAGDNLYKMVLSNNLTTTDMDFHTAMYKDAFPFAPNFGACPPQTLYSIGNATTPIAADLDDENDVLISKSAISGSLFFITNLNNTTPNCTPIQSQTVNIPGMPFDASCIKVSPEASSTIKRFYVADNSGKLYKVTWTSGSAINATAIDIMGTLPLGQVIVGIDVQGINDNEIVVVYENTGASTQNIFYTNNYNATGTSVPTWTSLESSGVSPIQGLPVRCVKFLRQGANNTMGAKIVIGTEIGCYTATSLTTGTSTVWTPDENGPDIPITQIQYRPASDGLLLMSTYGRGLWKSDTYTGYSLDFIPNIYGCQYQLANTSTGATGIVEWEVNGDGIYDASGNTLGTCILPGAGNIVTMRIGGVGGPSISKSLVDLTPICPTCGYPCCGGGGGGGSSKVGNNTDFSLFPNPTNGLINMLGDISSIRKIVIFNLQGKVIGEYDSFENRLLDISNCVSGFYLVKVIDINGNNKVYKITKE